jgi:hypothetical protein
MLQEIYRATIPVVDWQVLPPTALFMFAAVNVILLEEVLPEV